MIYQITVIEIQDIRRVAYYKQVKSKKGIKKTSPTLNSFNPVFKPQWKIYFSQKDKLQFCIRSLQDKSFNQILCIGWIDLKKFARTHKKQQNSLIFEKIIMDSCYNNFSQLSCKIQKSTKFQNQIKEENLFERYSKSNFRSVKSSKTFKSQQSNRSSFYKGVCHTQNLFSFLDSPARGQKFNFIEQSIMKK